MDLHKFYMGEIFDAYRFLGAHLTEGGAVFRTFAPGAERVTLIGEFNNWQEWDMQIALNGQFFEVFVPGAKPGQMYKYVIYGRNSRVEHCDPYGFGMELRPAFASIIRDMNAYRFHDEEWMQSRTLNYDKPLNIYEMHPGSWERRFGELGQNPEEKKTGAEAAETESEEAKLDPETDLAEEDLPEGESAASRKEMHDAVATLTEGEIKAYKPGNANTAVIPNLHAESAAQKSADPEAQEWYRYDEIADDLITYLKANHYTHVEFMPLAEHPFDGSWGYQTTGFFAPTSRYGTADQLKYLVDRLHQAGLGAIIDFVPAHFALDYYGLRQYDGTELYEYPASDVSVSEWGSCNFIYSRREVACFVQSAANYWLSEYHFDGLRMDAVSRIIYWMGDENKGVNDVAVDFLRKMNAGLHQIHPTAMLIAEDSTSFNGCTTPSHMGGLGFDYKWDLGWMNDTLDYFMKQSHERSSVPEKLTFSMYYFYRERHLLPLSHDEVVYGKKTIIDKIFGEYEDKFPQLRTLYTYMYLHPGKKLNFMGNELAMFREWDETREPDYSLLEYPNHSNFYRFMKRLNEVYCGNPALFERDYESYGFEWITMNEGGSNVFGITRRAAEQTVRAFFNFSNRDTVYYYEPEEDEVLIPLLDTDAREYGGKSATVEVITTQAGKAAAIQLPAFSSIVYTSR